MTKKSKSLAVCSSTCSKSCKGHRSKATSAEQNYYQETRLELLDAHDGTHDVTSRLWTQGTTDHEERMRTTLNNFSQTLPK
ncbi:hypothetical protein SUNI508_08195 [Seiridium unicorne]|uniref:Uncharacterized protein n=1 Tax=Seiridium unicorne TaxID=138068 RepID=A0ABR2UUB8_9PEZI